MLRLQNWLMNIITTSPNAFYDHLHHLRLDTVTGIDIVGAAVPLIKKPGSKYWTKTTLPFMAHGYEELVTPLHARGVEARTLGGEVVRPDDGRVAPRRARAHVALLDHGHVLHAVVLGQVVGGGHSVGAAADDDGVIARPQVVRAEEAVLAQKADHAGASCGSRTTTLARAMPIVSPASRIASQKYSPISTPRASRSPRPGSARWWARA